MSNLPCITLMCALDVCIMHPCMPGMHMPNLDYACMQIVSLGQRNILYKYVHVVGVTPIVIQDINPAKEILTVKLKRLQGVSFTDYHW